MIGQSVFGYIAAAERCERQQACLRLQVMLQEGNVRSKGPLANGSPTQDERHTKEAIGAVPQPGEHGDAHPLCLGVYVPWFEVSSRTCWRSGAPRLRSPGLAGASKSRLPWSIVQARLDDHVNAPHRGGDEAASEGGRDDHPLNCQGSDVAFSLASRKASRSGEDDREDNPESACRLVAQAQRSDSPEKKNIRVILGSISGGDFCHTSFVYYRQGATTWTRLHRTPSGSISSASGTTFRGRIFYLLWKRGEVRVLCRSGRGG